MTVSPVTRIVGPACVAQRLRRMLRSARSPTGKRGRRRRERPAPATPRARRVPWRRVLGVISDPARTRRRGRAMRSPRGRAGRARGSRRVRRDGRRGHQRALPRRAARGRTRAPGVAQRSALRRLEREAWAQARRTRASTQRRQPGARQAARGAREHASPRDLIRSEVRREPQRERRDRERGIRRALMREDGATDDVEIVRAEDPQGPIADAPSGVSAIAHAPDGCEPHQRGQSPETSRASRAPPIAWRAPRQRATVSWSRAVAGRSTRATASPKASVFRASSSSRPMPSSSSVAKPPADARKFARRPPTSAISEATARATSTSTSGQQGQSHKPKVPCSRRSTCTR